MPAPHQAAMNERGYIFVLPSLGLVDPAGEWVSVKAAITTSARQSASVALQNPSLNGPPCYPSGEYTIVEAEYEGAVWFLPIVQHSEAAEAGEPDFFTVQAQRVPFNAAIKIDRIKIPNKAQTICLKPPFLGIDSSIDPSGDEVESDAAAEREEESKQRSAWDFARSRPRSASSSSSESSSESESSSSWAKASRPSTPQEADQEAESGGQSEGEEKAAAEVKEQEQAARVNSHEEHKEEEEDEEETEEWKNRMFDELRSGEIFHNDPWKQQVYYEMLAEALGNNVSINEDANPNIKIKFAPAPNDAYRGMIYAVRAEGDSRPIREEEWKPLPWYATKPGFQRYFVNMGRELGGHAPFGREEWPPGAAHAEEGS